MEARMKENEARMNKSLEEETRTIQQPCANEFFAHTDFLQARLVEQEKNTSDILVSEKKIQSCFEVKDRRKPTSVRT